MFVTMQESWRALCYLIACDWQGHEGMPWVASMQRSLRPVRRILGTSTFRADYSLPR